MGAYTATDLKKFLEDNNVPLMLTEMVESLCVTQPKDCVAHMIQWLQNYQVKNGKAGTKQQINFIEEPEKSIPYVEDEDPDVPSAVTFSESMPLNGSKMDDKTSEHNRRRYSYIDRRRGVSSEATTADIKSPSAKMRKQQLGPETKARIEKCMLSNILFRSLHKDALEVVYTSMFEKTAEAGTFIMKQYDEGDNFYVIESGTCNILIQSSPTAEPVLKSSIGPGASFGELALMYGTPRAASVQAVTNVKLWALDRDTFRRILLTQTMRKRRQYEDFLSQVPLFETLTSYERLTMADALQPCTFQDQEVVVQEGEDGGAFYVIIDGKMRVTQTLNGRVHTINVLGSKDFFGEMSLMFNQPCVATVISEGTSHCVSLDRESFTALLGPMEEILQRNIQNYSSKHEEASD